MTPDLTYYWGGSASVVRGKEMGQRKKKKKITHMPCDQHNCRNVLFCSCWVPLPSCLCVPLSLFLPISFLLVLSSFLFFSCFSLANGLRCAGSPVFRRWIQSAVDVPWSCHLVVFARFKSPSCTLSPHSSSLHY